MPNKYEREIEEILSRMEESEPRKGLGDRIRPFRRPARPRGTPSLHIPLMELLFLLAIVFILIASGLAFYEGAPTLLSGVVGLVGLVLFVVALVAGWRDRFRPLSQARWRGNTVDPHRIRHGPFGALAAQVRIWRLRQQYRRAQARLDEPDD
jgi:hypothetical protein